MKTPTRVTWIAATTAVVSAALVGGPMAAAASAAPVAGSSTVVAASAPAVRPASAPAVKPASAPAVSRQSNAAAVRAATLKKYGVFPLPVSVKQINKYHLSKKDLRGIQQAQKLAKSPTARRIRQRESHNNYKINTGNGYYGAYQFNRGTWRANGGAKFAKTANKAPKWAQDYVVWRTHKVRGWSPWSTR